ncbi:MAG: FAD-dependent oxidoreductase [Anaerolineales bacterium]|nr:FAD-dependent oxidoreductase [Anaerolineales bacterium]
MELDLTLPSTGNGHSTGAEELEYDLIIIGGGPAGATAALYAARADLRTLVVDKGVTAGALGLTAKIANYPGVPGEISGAELVERIRQQAASFGAQFVQDKVQAVELEGERKIVYTNTATYTARAVIIATGSMGRGQRVPGEDRLLGRGVSYCATCDAAFFRDQEVAVVGSDDEAVEEALFLTKFARRIHLVSPTPELKAVPEQAGKIAAHPKVELHLGTSLREVIGQTKVEGIRVAPRGRPEQVLPVSGVFIYLQGNRPITDFLQGQLPTSETGCLIVDHEFRTAIPGVYAIGDVLCNHVKQAVVAAAEGAVAAMAVEKELHGRKQLAVDWSK